MKFFFAAVASVALAANIDTIETKLSVFSEMVAGLNEHAKNSMIIPDGGLNNLDFPIVAD